MHHNDGKILSRAKTCSLKLFNPISYEGIMNLQICRTHNFGIVTIVMYASPSIT